MQEDNDLLENEVKDLKVKLEVRVDNLSKKDVSKKEVKLCCRMTCT